MANDKDFILKNAIEIGGNTKVTIGDAPASGSRVSGFADVSAWAYDSVSFSASSQSTNLLNAVLFSSDGTRMYTLHGAASIYQYSLSTAWDVSTASYDNKSFDPTSQGTNNSGGSFNSDGTKFYKTDGQTDTIYEYDLSTAWDISTASYNSVSLSVSAQDTSPTGMTFNSTGTKMYMVGGQNDRVYQYSLSTAYDLSTASYDSVFFSVQTQSLNPESVVFNNDGTKMFISCNSNDAVFQYDLTTAYDVSTATYNTKTFSVASQAAAPYGIRFSADGDKMYIASATDVTVYQYSTGSTVATATFDTSTGNYFTHTPSADSEYGFSNAGDVQTWQLEVTGAVKGYELSGAAYDSVELSVSGQTTGPHGIKINNDGTKLYLINSTGDAVLQYSMSTANDLSTASYDSVSFSVTSQAGLPRDLAFNSDGTKMYVVGSSSDSVFQYSLSTAFDVSTASYDSVSLSVSSQETNPFGMTLNDDGTKLYIVGSTSDAVFQYSMSTSYDLSTASYDSVSLSISAQDTNPRGIAFNDSGTKMYIAGNTSDAVLQYSLSTAYDLSTASYDSVSFSTSSQDTSPFGIAFSSDGAKMFIAGDGNDKIYQYSTGSAITITWDADIQWAGGTAPDSPAANEKDIYTITTDDGGTTYVGVQSGDNFS
jgi:DNA-binding beta-propeller fold protein YncE